MIRYSTEALKQRGRLLCVLLCGVFSVCYPGAGQEADVSVDDMSIHVRYLASDELEGRRAGTEGNNKAAAYVARVMKGYGLTPAGDSGTFFQSFRIVSALKAGRANAFSFEGNSLSGQRVDLRNDTDFRPLGLTANDTVTAPLVFAGYGISAPDKNYDDYANVDVAGKIVIVLRYTPEGKSVHSALYRYSTFRNKSRTARNRGAKGLIVVSGPADDEADGLVPLNYDPMGASSEIPVVSMKRESVDKLLKPLGVDVRSVEDSIRIAKKPVVFEIPGITARLATEVVRVTSRTSNVIGYLEGMDSVLSSQVIVIGAHYDHLGYGGPGSGSLQPDVHSIHNGADDNASGTAGLLELARVMAQEKSRQRRSIVFIAFSAEELGTLGSDYYVNHPFIPLSRTVAMFNLDMIGRLENNALTVYGTGTSPTWKTLLSRYNDDSTFSLKLIADGYGPSDHAVFYGKNIPVLFFFTGIHADYHRPSDDWEKLNYKGEATILRYVFRLIKGMDIEAARPPFARAPSTLSATSGSGAARALPVTLGIVPDYGPSSDGMKIGGVRPEGPADNAGLKSGDVIVRIGTKDVRDIYDYMDILSLLKAGTEVDLEVLREGKTLKATAIVQPRQ